MANIKQKRRCDAGRWLREVREQRGLTQRELARKVRTKHHTFISQIENGRIRIPPHLYPVWAGALGLEPREFAQRLLSYHDPAAYRILFGRGAR
jgi:transcriptional regulator with XRE-family HTH domain